MRPAPRWCGRGGQWGGGSFCLVPFLYLPWAGNKAGVTGVVLVMEGVAPIPLRFVLACLLWARSVRRPGALARVRLLPAVPVGAGGWGGGAGRALAPLTGAAISPGGRGDHPLCLGGVRAGAPAACEPAGGVGGGVAPRPPCSSSGGRPAVPYPSPPLVVGAFPPWRAPSVGVAGPPRAPGAACLAGGGGGRGGPWTAPPGAPSDPRRPSALPEWATLWVSRAMLWSWGARPSYCSGAPPRAAPGAVRAPLRRAGSRSPISRDPRGSRRLGALGRAVCRSSCASYPPASRSSLGEGGRPLGSGGVGGRRSCGPQAGGGAGEGGGGPLRRPPPPRLVGCRPAILRLRRAPPEYTCAVGVAGRPWASGAAWSAANGSVRRGGEGGRGGVLSSPSFAPPPSPGPPPKGLLRLRRPGRCRSAVGW